MFQVELIAESYKEGPRTGVLLATINLPYIPRVNEIIVMVIYDSDTQKEAAQDIYEVINVVYYLKAVKAIPVGQLDFIEYNPKDYSYPSARVTVRREKSAEEFAQELNSLKQRRKLSKEQPFRYLFSHTIEDARNFFAGLMIKILEIEDLGKEIRGHINTKKE